MVKSGRTKLVPLSSHVGLSTMSGETTISLAVKY